MIYVDCLFFKSLRKEDIIERLVEYAQEFSCFGETNKNIPLMLEKMKKLDTVGPDTASRLINIMTEHIFCDDHGSSYDWIYHYDWSLMIHPKLGVIGVAIATDIED